RSATGEIVDFRCEYLNQRACKLLAQQREDFIGTPLYRQFIFLPDAQVFQGYCAVVEGGETYSYVFHDDALAHATRWFECQAVRLNDGIALTVRDISEKKRTEHDLMHAEHF